MTEKKRILFVDDEPFVLKGLQRMLWRLRGEWDMAFVESGRHALELMEQQPFDVVVSDIRMPEMNGAELLNKILRRHPRTIRFVLSAHADHDLVLKCVGCTHQFLSKPCTATDLQSAIRRAMALDSLLQNNAIKETLTRLENLPSMPALYGELVALLHRPDTPIEDVVRIIEKDPAMTAQILKFVNSTFFALHHSISNVSEACTHLGMDTIRSLVLFLKTFSQFQNNEIGGLRLESMWQHSMRTAAAARCIAQVEQAPAKTLDEAFAAGLLHDVGKLILANNYPHEYQQLLQQTQHASRDLIEAEHRVFGCEHEDIGGYLMGLWGLPPSIVEAIALHHHPSRSPNPGFSPLTAVHAANILVQECEAVSDPAGPEGMDASYLESLAMEDRPDQWRREAAQLVNTSL